MSEGNTMDSRQGVDVKEAIRKLVVERAAALKAGAPQEYATAIEAALIRLTDENRTGMGRLFKAIALSPPKLHVLPGFET